MKKLIKTERIMLLLTGPNYNSYRCPTHGVYQVPKSRPEQGCAYQKECTADIITIADPIAYADSH